MEIFAAFVSYGAVTVMAVLIVVLLRDGRGFNVTPYAIGAAITSMAIVLGTLPAGQKLPSPFHPLVRFADAPNLAMIWWFGLAIFKDGFRPKIFEWSIMIANVFLIWIYRLQEFGSNVPLIPWHNLILDILSVGMMAHLAYVVFKDRADDLVEGRRKARGYFLIGLALSGTVAIFAENILMKDYPEIMLTIRASIIFTMAIWGILWLTRLSTEKIEFRPTSPAPVRPKTNIDPRDHQLLQRLQEKMRDENLYTQPNLTIRSLSEILKTPEHRLRVLINQGLGHRNFSEFLNGYRIKAVQTAFSDPNNSRTPILTIALDAGYNSLAPFNRAFKSATGQTPSAFRAALQAKPDQF